MIDPMSSAIYRDIAADPTIRERLKDDINLDVDAFAEKHGQTIIEHYAGQHPIEPEYAIDMAASVWWHLHPDYELPLPGTPEHEEYLAGADHGGDRPGGRHFWPL